MTVKELIELLKEHDPEMEVEIQTEANDWSHSLYMVSEETVTRGLALPVPKTYKIVVLSS